MTDTPAETIRITCPGCGDSAEVENNGDRVVRLRCRRCRTWFTLSDHSEDQTERERAWMLAEEDEGVVIL